jgi:hypothetical protein
MTILGPETLLTRDKAAAALAQQGYPITKTTLATLASRGGGPHYRNFGRRVLYRWPDLKAWAEARGNEAEPVKAS